jgi:putative FmdB family regulatory protein
MPIYEYVCDDCQTRYERVVMSSSQKISCPKCASKRHTLQLSVFSAGKSSNGSKSADASCSPSGGFCGCTPDGCGCN